MRSAILAADADTTPDIIAFNLGGGGHETITLASALPTITNTVTFDGTSQPGYSGTPLVEINGGGLAIDLLDLQAPNSVVKGLVLNNITGYTAAINDLGGGAVIQGDYIGTDWTGTVAVGSSPAFGILPGTTGLIGGAVPWPGQSHRRLFLRHPRLAKLRGVDPRKRDRHDRSGNRGDSE